MEKSSPSIYRDVHVLVYLVRYIKRNVHEMSIQNRKSCVTGYIKCCE